MKKISLGLSAAACIFGTAANAALLEHNRVGFQWYLGTNLTPYDPEYIMDINPIGVLHLDHAASEISITDKTITFTSGINFNSHFNAAPYNGFMLWGIDKTIPSFTQVEIVSSNLQGLTPNRISFSGDSIFVNLQQLNNFPGMKFSIEVSASAVPEPSPLILCLAGISSVILLAKRRSSSFFNFKDPYVFGHSFG
jgi:hypothetical protein